MFNPDDEIEAGMRVLHDDGLHYRVEELILSTDGYELTHALGATTVIYTQLEAGGYPVGQRWAKNSDGFRQYFTPEADAN